MPYEIKIYRMKDFIRKNESGLLDRDRSRRLVREVATASSFCEDCHILVDLRKTGLRTSSSLADLMELALEFATLLPDFHNKIATLIPDDQERIDTAKRFEACMTVQGFSYEAFTDYEDAIEWLSEGERSDMIIS